MQSDVSTSFYQCIWLDSHGEQGGTRFFATDDTAALAIATRLAALSGCRLLEYAKVAWVAAIETHAPADGSNIQDKTWLHYQAAQESGGPKPMKLSVPALDRSLLEIGGRKTDTDLLEGVGALTTRAGRPATAFVKGINVYGLRKRDKAT